MDGYPYKIIILSHLSWDSRVHCVAKTMLFYHNESRLEYSKLHKLGHNEMYIALVISKVQNKQAFVTMTVL